MVADCCKYWRVQGATDKIAGMPKPQSFFIAWFGESGMRIYAAYRIGYTEAKND